MARTRPNTLLSPPGSFLGGAALLGALALGGWWVWPRAMVLPSTAASDGPPAGAPASAAAPGDGWAPQVTGPAAQRAADEVLVPRAAVAGGPDSSDFILARQTESDAREVEERAGALPAAEGDQAARAPGDEAPAASGDPRIAAALSKYADGQVIAARHELNRLLADSRGAREQAELRHHLERISLETIFSPQRWPDDPLIESYTVQSGDVLIRIGKRFHVPADVIMLLNGGTDRIHAGQVLKVPRGPFNLRISLSQFRMDVYLQDLFVRSLPVGLGADGGTPIGEWLVKNRQINPTYYPPPSSSVKRIMPPGDPENPLGGRWIGLEGVAGAALGKTGYGIHGTIEPETIGKAASLGCIRMYNDDVAWVFKLVCAGQSRVTTTP